ncbi:hypothetical protein HDU99_001136 [Rhizoclosmatium hyalinum]|nr:hypothetical protein HDU99_001136 [Rhizoclosmatium hyalinum]
MKGLLGIVVFALPALASQCIKSAVVKTGDTCSSLAFSVGAQVSDFEAANPGITCPNPTVGLKVCLVLLDDLEPAPARPAKKQVGPPIAGKTYYYCNDPHHVGLTFDDGPSHWTGDLLDWLNEQGLKATFFINGWNFDCACIYDEPYIGFLKRAHKEGHQIASHTWSHPSLDTLTESAIRWEMNKLADATYRILGFVPRYMRPPFGAGLQNSTVTGILKNMGYVIVGWSLDTVDATIDDENPYQFNTPHLLSDAEYLNATVTRIKAQISGTYNPGGAYIALEHDVYNRTVRYTGPNVVKLTRQAGYAPVPAAVCLGDTNPKNWYRNYTTPQPRDPKTWVCKEKLGFENCQPWQWRCKSDGPFICN